MLPLCVRVLPFEVNVDGLTNASNSHHLSDSGYESRPSTTSGSHHSPALSDTDVSITSSQQPTASIPLTTQYDPAMKPNSYSYSRPMEDISRYIILYTSHSSTPVLCPTAAFEHSSLCTRVPTPGDFSETFCYGPEIEQALTATKGAGKGTEMVGRNIDEMAAKYVMSSGLSSNRELIDRMWIIWHEMEDGGLEHDWLGRVKYSWQEVQSIIDGGRDRPVLPPGWPVSD